MSGSCGAKNPHAFFPKGEIMYAIIVRAGVWLVNLVVCIFMVTLVFAVLETVCRLCDMLLDKVSYLFKKEGPCSASS